MPKLDLIGLLQVALQNRVLKIPSGLEYGRELVEESQHFQMKPQLASDAMADMSWRERPHDDLVLALALACWQAERDWPHDEWADCPAVPTVIDRGFGCGGSKGQPISENNRSVTVTRCHSSLPNEAAATSGLSIDQQ